jgi:hypothetical protein
MDPFNNGLSKGRKPITTICKPITTFVIVIINQTQNIFLELRAENVQWKIQFCISLFNVCNEVYMNLRERKYY